MGIFQYQTMINVATKNLNKMNLFSGNKFLTIQWNILLPAKVTEKTYLYIGVSGESYIMVTANQRMVLYHQWMIKKEQWKEKEQQWMEILQQWMEKGNQWMIKVKQGMII